ncbi:MAG: hypothetical protein GX127_04305 [Eubacteriaceae bacterium]|nr:hypothetical protein [Eubacteriaceae bacterium]
MNLMEHEKSILSKIYKNIEAPNREALLLTLYAAKPVDDGSSDAQAMIQIINDLIAKVFPLTDEDISNLFESHL